MPDAPRPPINEVVYSVALARQAALSGPQLPSILGDWFNQHSRVETALPYEISPEPNELIGALPVQKLQLIAQSLPRYWLISPDEQELIQVQLDYLALNWRYRNDTSTYPGYEEMRARFSGLLETVSEGLVRHQGILNPTRAELTYINLVRPNALWSSHGDTHKLINVTLPADSSYEQLGFSYSRQLAGLEGEFAGRLHVTLSPAVDWVKNEPQLTLTLTARSADIPGQSIEPVLAFMDLAHSAIENSFRNIIRKDARSAWGLE